MYCRRRSQPLSDYQTARPAETNRYHVPLWTLTKLDKGTSRWGRGVWVAWTQRVIWPEREFPHPVYLLCVFIGRHVHRTHNSHHTNCATPTHYESIKMHPNNLICRRHICIKSLIYVTRMWLLSNKKNNLSYVRKIIFLSKKGNVCIASCYYFFLFQNSNRNYRNFLLHTHHYRNYIIYIMMIQYHSLFH